MQQRRGKAKQLPNKLLLATAVFEERHMLLREHSIYKGKNNLDVRNLIPILQYFAGSVLELSGESCGEMEKLTKPGIQAHIDQILAMRIRRATHHLLHL